MAKAREIRDLSGKQWDKFDASLQGLLKSDKDGDDRYLAIHALNLTCGRWRFKPGAGVQDQSGRTLVPPSGGYGSDLVDGAVSLVQHRRKFFKEMPHD